MLEHVRKEEWDLKTKESIGCLDRNKEKNQLKKKKGVKNISQ